LNGMIVFCLIGRSRGDQVTLITYPVGETVNMSLLFQDGTKNFGSYLTGMLVYSNGPLKMILAKSYCYKQSMDSNLGWILTSVRWE